MEEEVDKSADAGMHDLLQSEAAPSSHRDKSDPILDVESREEDQEMAQSEPEKLEEEQPEPVAQADQKSEPLEPEEKVQDEQVCVQDTDIVEPSALERKDDGLLDEEPQPMADQEHPIDPIDM